MRRIVTAGLVLLALALPSTSSAQALTVGIADQRPGTFHDERLTSLVHNARLSVAWDAMRYDWQRREIDTWMAGARAVGITPLVTFGRSRTRPFSLPPVDVYREAVLRFRHRYPDVREYSPWNEPNLAVRKANYDPRRIAGYYLLLRRMCPSCDVLGADVVDTSSLDRWMRAYLHEFPRDRRPRLWGLHNYVDVNSTSSWGTRTMRRLAPGEIWFTETGAIVRRRTPTSIRDNDRRSLIQIGGGAHAVEATRRVFSLAATSDRVTRVYIYHWKATRSGSWDSALVAPDGELRPSFDVFAAQARRALASPPVPASDDRQQGSARPGRAVGARAPAARGAAGRAGSSSSAFTAVATNGDTIAARARQRGQFVSARYSARVRIVRRHRGHCRYITGGRRGSPSGTSRRQRARPLRRSIGAPRAQRTTRIQARH